MIRYFTSVFNRADWQTHPPLDIWPQMRAPAIHGKCKFHYQLWRAQELFTRGEGGGSEPCPPPLQKKNLTQLDEGGVETIFLPV